MQFLATRKNMSAVDPEADSLGVQMVALERLKTRWPSCSKQVI